MTEPDEKTPQAGDTRPARPPFTGLSAPFLRRTVWATLVTALLVAVMTAYYIQPRWAGWYLFSALWSLGFLGLTPLIMKSLLFDRRPLRGLLLIGVKLVWLGVMFVFCLKASASAANKTLFGSALIAGIVTPLGVVALRAAGAALEARKAAAPTTRGTKKG